MRVAARVLAILATVFLASRPAAAGPTEGFVRVAADGRTFTVNGKVWHPFGCNYFDPHVGWAPKLWQKFDAEEIEKHFRIMRDLGVNVVRVFLTAQSFYPKPPKLDPEGLKKFDKLLAIARRYGIRVHPTGPDHWEGNPPWRRTDIFANPKALEAQAAFWEAFAARYRNEPAIFAYDLLNEPHVRWRSKFMRSAWQRWLARRYGSVEELRKRWGKEADGLRSFADVEIPADRAAPQSVALLDYQRFRESMAERWVRVQVEAIRKVDRNHLVTVGLVQWSVPVLIGKPSRYAAFRPSRIGPMVDFLSVHFYPLWGDPLAGKEQFDRNLAYLEFVLRYVAAGAREKPLVVGEFGWYGGGKATERRPTRSQEDQARWCRAAVLQGRGMASGWLNWAFADTPSARDITKFSGLVTEDGRTKAWGEAFRQFATKTGRWMARPVEPPAAIEFKIDRALTDPGTGDAALERFFEKWKVARHCGILLR